MESYGTLHIGLEAASLFLDFPPRPSVSPNIREQQGVKQIVIHQCNRLCAAIKNDDYKGMKKCFCDAGCQGLTVKALL